MNTNHPQRKKFVSISLTVIGFFLLRSALSSVAGFVFNKVFKKIWTLIFCEKETPSEENEDTKK